MNTSKFIAKIIGLIYLSVGIGYLVSPDYYMVALQGFFKASLSMYILGMLLIIGGLAIIQYHNIWENTWKVWITIIGWGSLIKGMLFLMFPTILSIFKDFINWPGYYSIGGTFSVILGLIFIFIGFFKTKNVQKEN